MFEDTTNHRSVSIVLHQSGGELVATFEKGHAKVGGRKAGTPNKATSMKAIMQRLAAEDGELLYGAIRAGPRTAIGE
jgi:hypothetical protein